MYISLKWVQKIVSLNALELPVLCERLTLAGFEIEEIIQKQILNELDFILDVSLTANRSDLFNVNSFSKELQSIFFQEEQFRSVDSLKYGSVKFSTLKNKAICFKYFVWQNFLQKRYFYRLPKNYQNPERFQSCLAFLSIESEPIKIKQSQPWLQKCLLASNITPVNNIIDTLNFVNLETGYPFFACDLDKLKQYIGEPILDFKIQKAKENEQLEIEQNNTVKLKQNNLVLYINNKPISVIGLLTIKAIEINETTTNIIVYGGLFDPIQIRKSAQSLGLRTEQSVSLEKNLNFNGFEQAFLRLSFLLNSQSISLKNANLPTIYNLTTLEKRSFVNYINNKRPKIKLEYKEVTNLLGSSIILEKENIFKILEALHFQIIHKNDTSCQLFVPFSRENDLEREVDIIEEIVRLSGFTSFVSIVPSVKNPGHFSKLEKLKRLLRKTLIELGFNEVLHYSISTFQSNTQLELKNPIVPESSFFRSNLLNQLIQKAELNKKQKNNAFEAFEIGRSYSMKNGNIIESELISGIFGGTQYLSNWSSTEKGINWFEAKGIIDKIFDTLNISVLWTKPIENFNEFLHPGRSAKILVNNDEIGFFGQIHPMIAKKYSLNNDIFLFEFNLEVLKNLWKAKQIYTYKAYSLFPTSLVDLACIKSDIISFKEVELRIRSIGGPLLESITLFDYYAGDPIPQGYHSLGFKLKFRNFERTLTNEEVEGVVKNITSSLEKEFDITIRQ
jgi:phenylalanyl-tRNA synthetase beta chain